MVYSCKKESLPSPSKSFTEEFDIFYKLAEKGWLTKDFFGNAFAEWSLGPYGVDKGGCWFGYSAYSYNTSKDEFAGSYVSPYNFPYAISSWLITPVLSVKNGDKISFYTRGDTIGSYIDRMQVLMNKSSFAEIGVAIDAVGDFTTVLFDINSTQAAGGFPTTWTKYEYTFSGISGKNDTRNEFRHYLTNTTNAKGIGIDLFRFQAD